MTQDQNPPNKLLDPLDIDALMAEANINEETPENAEGNTMPEADHRPVFDVPMQVALAALGDTLKAQLLARKAELQTQLDRLYAQRAQIEERIAALPYVGVQPITPNAEQRQADDSPEKG